MNKGRRILLAGLLLKAGGLAFGAAPARLVAGPPVEVQIEVTEVDHTKATRLGIEWVETARVVENPIRDIVELGPLERVTQIRADLHFLLEQGAAELLANPNLITDSGTSAAFHAGGQIPYVTSTSLGASHVQFKSYGVGLNIEPKVLENGLIRMKVDATVSAPDPINGVLVAGNAVPALLERTVSSNVTLKSGATMTLAGLVQTQKNETTRGLPVLSKIPVLGFLFRWQRTLFRRTTIVIFVTPKLVSS